MSIGELARDYALPSCLGKKRCPGFSQTIRFSIELPFHVSVMNDRGKNSSYTHISTLRAYGAG